VLATVARATTARLSGTTTRLFNDRATTARLFDGTRRLFGGTTAAGLFDGAAAAAFATGAAVTTTKQLRIGLALHRQRQSHNGHHANGGTQHKILTHRKSSKRN
jgi:hypothetical protein